MKKIVVLVLVALFILVGCGKNEAPTISVKDFVKSVSEASEVLVHVDSDFEDKQRDLVEIELADGEMFKTELVKVLETFKPQSIKKTEIVEDGLMYVVKELSTKSVMYVYSDSKIRFSRGADTAAFSLAEEEFKALSELLASFVK